MRFACDQVGPVGIDILIEPINGRDMPGYFLTRQDQAHALIAEIGAATATPLLQPAQRVQALKKIQTPDDKLI